MLKILMRSRGSMDRAFDYGSKGWGFESLRDREFFCKNFACIITICNSISFDIIFFGVFYHYKQNKIIDKDIFCFKKQIIKYI